MNYRFEFPLPAEEAEEIRTFLRDPDGDQAPIVHEFENDFEICIAFFAFSDVVSMEATLKGGFDEGYEDLDDFSVDILDEFKDVAATWRFEWGDDVYELVVCVEGEDYPEAVYSNTD